MELPNHLKQLYRHWNAHTAAPANDTGPAGAFRSPILREIEWLIHERINMWKRKVTGETPPYTKDADIKDLSVL